MFLVANTTKDSIIVTDLNLHLGVRQAIDLHKVNLAKAPEKSGELRAHITSGAIKILKQDSKKSKKLKDSKKIVNNTIVNNTIDQEELVKSIAAMVKKEVDSQTKDNKEIMEALSGLSSLVKNQKSTVIVQGQGEVVTKKKREELVLDNEDLIQIHKRSVDSMTEKTEGNLKYEDQEITDDTMEYDMSLLEDLL